MDYSFSLCVFRDCFLIPLCASFLVLNAIHRCSWCSDTVLRLASKSRYARVDNGRMISDGGFGPLNTSVAHLKFPSVFLPRHPTGDWFTTFCIASTITGHFPTAIFHSDINARTMHSISLHNHFTVPFDHGQ